MYYHRPQFGNGILLKIVKHIRWQLIFERWVSLSSCFVEPASYPNL